ncbi:hypothetical protein GCM10009122_23210 [Fulvivirga kasyanovii]|uniref:YncE family protein n=1 Tax=Fulvivirga kasyanovii TaxID=396812 RepID=A0ABW9RXL8_9BACT|nr:YncE family protein [Fulvivirga kasyanovii]MTI28973.1 YncE family protein [Fulvivirga kasyanovii]
MNKGLKIGLIATATAGVGLVCSMLLKKRDQNTPSVDDTAMDSFSPQKVVKTPEDQYKEDLKRFGTKQGVIDVSDNSNPQKKKKKLRRIEKKGRDLLKAYIAKREKQKQLHPLAGYSSTQISITNHSDQERKVFMWGGNRGLPLSPSLPSDVEDLEPKESIVTGIHPQRVVVNPANGYAYITNQLSDSVTVVTSTGKLVKAIQLEPSSFPGYNSPVAIAVNDDPASAAYGKVYVAGSVSNTISVIDLNLEVSRVIEPPGVRPLDIAFDKITGHLYIANLVSGDITIIDTMTEEVANSLVAGRNLTAIAINGASGDIYAAWDGKVIVFNTMYERIALINTIGRASSIRWFPPDNIMYVAFEDSQKLLSIGIIGDEISLETLDLGHLPGAMSYNDSNRLLYVTSINTDQMSLVSSGGSINVIPAPSNGYTGIALSGSTVFITGGTADETILADNPAGSSQVTTDEDYFLKSKHFQSDPAIVGHVKFIFSGTTRPHVLHVEEQNATGRIKKTPLSLSHYQSPRDFQNVAEAGGLKNTMLDGRTGWGFSLGPKQTISMVIWYKQFEMRELLPKNETKQLKTITTI